MSWSTAAVHDMSSAESCATSAAERRGYSMRLVHERLCDGRQHVDGIPRFVSPSLRRRTYTVAHTAGSCTLSSIPFLPCAGAAAGGLVLGGG